MISKKTQYHSIIIIFFSIILLSCQSPALPEEYKSYKTLEEGVKSEHYKVSLFYESYFPNDGSGISEPTFYTTLNGNAIVSLKKKSSKYEMYYKLNDDGKVIDSISSLAYLEKTDDLQFPILENYYKFVKGFLIDDKNYNTWGIDGNSDKKALTKINENLTWDKAQISKAISENVNFIVGTDDKEIYFYNKDKFNILFLGDFVTSDFQELEGKYINGDNREDFINYIKIDYFQTKSKETIETSVGGGSQPFSESGNLGNWFTSIYFKGEPLKIKFENVVTNRKATSFYNEGGGHFDVSYYSFNNKNFAILFVLNSYYIIKKK